jgi:cytochrome P450
MLKNLPPDSASLEEFYKFIGDDKYLNAFIWEVLRLHPPVPADTKIALNSFKLPSGLEIPKDTTIGWITYSLGRRESVWGNDALKFKPTRWIEQSRELFDESKLQYIFPVFNAGYRTCLGKNMAFFEAKLLLVMIAKKFKFQVVHHQREISYHPNNVTLWMKDPFMVFVRKR